MLVTLSFSFNFLVCVDSPDCASIVENDRELCKKREDYMKENCPQSCGFCGKITYRNSGQWYDWKLLVRVIFSLRCNNSTYGLKVFIIRINRKRISAE